MTPLRLLYVCSNVDYRPRLQVLSWLCKKGEDILTKHAQHSATNLTTARLNEREFEKFYFTSMVSRIHAKNTPRYNGIESSLCVLQKFHFFHVPSSRSSRSDTE